MHFHSLEEQHLQLVRLHVKIIARLCNTQPTQCVKKRGMMSSKFKKNAWDLLIRHILVLSYFPIESNHFVEGLEFENVKISENTLG